MELVEPSHVEHRRPAKQIAEPAAPPSSPSPDRALAAERTLLDIARTALTRGDAAGALAAIERHSLEFPNGALSEDREVLRVQSLLAQGHSDQALAAARTFETQYPHSFSLPALKASLGEAP
jgi:outer membrane protein assembly factor BamD (BamD/ComL family)